MAQQRTWVAIATLGPLGYLPASGTLGALCGIPLSYAIKYYTNTLISEFLILLVLTLCSYYLIGKAYRHFTQKDPSQIILDEVVGCLWVFFGIPLTIPVIITGFCIFRILDITKIFGIRYCEKASGAMGILLDDVVAGIFTNLILCLVLLLV